MSLDIPPWPNPATPAGQTFFSNAKAIYAAFKGAGASNPFAIGFVSNAEAESSLNPDAKGDIEHGDATAFGLWQLHADRVAAIKAALDIDIAAGATIEAQVEAVLWELNSHPYLGVAQIRAATTAHQAAYQICATFERAGAADAGERRGEMATRWAAYFGKAGA